MPIEHETIRIRHTDLCPPDGQPFNPDHCTTALDMRQRIAALEREIAAIKTAFLIDDLGRPDFDGHRADHRLRREAAKVMEGYKITATHKVIAALVAGFIFVFSAGITAEIKSYFDRPHPHPPESK
jgi:hypothetical protein